MTNLARKVIALMLCVVMFAGLAAHAFADGPAVGVVNPFDYYRNLRDDYLTAVQTRYNEMQAAYWTKLLEQFVKIVAVYGAQKEAYEDWAKGIKALSVEQYLALQLEYETMREAAKKFQKEYEDAKKAGAAAAQKASADAQKALGEGTLSPEEAIRQAKNGVTDAIDDAKATMQEAADDYSDVAAFVKALSEEEEAELKRKRKLLQEELERRLREAQALAANAE